MEEVLEVLEGRALSAEEVLIDTIDDGMQHQRLNQMLKVKRHLQQARPLLLSLCKKSLGHLQFKKEKSET